MTIELAILGFALVAPIAWTTLGRKWSNGLLLIMVLMVFEGALRKWLLPQFQAQIYLLKDGLLIIVALGFWAHVRHRGVHEPLLGTLKALLIANLAFAFLQIFNPNSPSPLVGVIGLKNYMLYTLLAFLVPYCFTSTADLERKLNIYILLMIPVALLGIVQYFSPPDSWINVYVQRDNEEMFISRMGTGEDAQRVRATGTFSYIGGFSTFVFAMFYFALAYVLAHGRTMSQNLYAYGLLLAATAASFTTGSRTVVFGIIGFAPLVLLLCLRARLITGRVFARILAIGLPAALVLMFLTGEAVDSFSNRATSGDDPIVRLLSPINETLNAFEVSPVIGFGIGTAHGSAGAIVGSIDPWWLKGTLFELETARVMQEVGIVGFVLTYAVRIYVVLLALWMLRTLRTPLFKSLCAVFVAYFLMHIVLFIVNNPTAALFYWFAVGLMFAMYRLDYEIAPARIMQRAHPAPAIPLRVIG